MPRVFDREDDALPSTEWEPEYAIEDYASAYDDDAEEEEDDEFDIPL